MGRGPPRGEKGKGGPKKNHFLGKNQKGDDFFFCPRGKKNLGGKQKNLPVLIIFWQKLKKPILKMGGNFPHIEDFLKD